MDNHRTPPHQDASKDTLAVIATLRTMVDQQCAILHAYGASAATCERARDALTATLMLAVEATIERRK